MLTRLVRLGIKGAAVLQAGGPGSGRHPGITSLLIGLHKKASLGNKVPLVPPLKSPVQASYKLPANQGQLDPHSTWIRHEDWHKQAYGGVVVNEKGQFLLREPTNHFDGYAWTFPKGKLDIESEHPADAAHREVAEETGHNTEIVDHVPGTFKGGTGSHNSYYLMKSTGRNAAQMDDETRSTRFADYHTARQLIGKSTNQKGRARDLAVLNSAHQRMQLYRTGGILAGGPGSGCHGDKCGRPEGNHLTKPVAFKTLKKTGWTPGGKAYVPGKEHLKGGLKDIFIHPTHGKLWVGTKNYYHQPLNTFTVTKGSTSTGLASKLQQLTQKPTTPAETPTTPKSTAAPTGGLPTGMATHYTDNENNVYKYDDGGTGKYHLGGDLTKDNFGLSPQSMKILQDQGTVSPLAESVGKALDKQFDKQVQEKPAFKAPEVSTVAIPKTSGPPNSDLTKKADQPALGGAHEKSVYTDKQGNDWLFKPATTLGGQSAPMMAHADEAASKIAMILRPEFSVAAKAATLEGTQGSIQKMIPTGQLRGDGGKYKDFVGRDVKTLQPWEVSALQKEQVLDWMLSNHDAHGGQFLRVSSQYPNGRGVVGIDKTQAFKFIGQDKLSADYHPNTMEQPPIYNKMWDAVKNGDLSFDPKNALATIKHAEGISDKDYKSILQPYADARFDGKGAGAAVAKDAFLQQAVDRKNGLRKDFEGFYSGLLGHKFEFEPTFEPGQRAYVSIKQGQKKESLPDKEATPSQLGTIKDALPALMKQYGADDEKNTLTDTILTKWQSAVDKAVGFSSQTPSQAQLEKTAVGRGLYAELAAKAGIGPSVLKQMHDDISSWKSTTSSAGASHIRAAAQDIMNGECCKSKYSVAWQMEHQITQAKLAQMHPEADKIALYRGLTGEVASQIKDASKKAGEIVYGTMGAEGWTDHNSTAGSFGSGGVMLKTLIPFENIITSYKTNPGSMSTHKSEKEYFVAFPGKKQKLSSAQIVGSAQASSIKASMTTTYIDGTEQSHRAIPEEWKRPYNGTEPIPVIELTTKALTPAELKKHAAKQQKQKKGKK